MIIISTGNNFSRSLDLEIKKEANESNELNNELVHDRNYLQVIVLW